MIKKVILTLLLMILLPAIVLNAQADELPDPGLLPDSPFYFVKSFFEEVRTFFAFSDQVKAERFIYLAEKRLAEAEALSEKEDISKTERAIERYQERLDKANQIATDSKKEDILERVAIAPLKHFSVLERVADSLPDTAKERIMKALENSENSQARALEVLSEINSDRALNVISDIAEAESDRLDKLKEEGTGTDVLENKVNRLEKVLDIIEEKSDDEDVDRKELILRLRDSINIFDKPNNTDRPLGNAPQNRTDQIKDRPVTDNNFIACTQEYAPVCGADGIVYSNRCVAEKQNKVRVLYEGKCKTSEEPADPNLLDGGPGLIVEPVPFTDKEIEELRSR